MTTDENPFIGKVALKAIIVRADGKVLVSRDSKQIHWDIPGGRLNMGERLAEGLAREVREELGVAIQVHEPVYTDTFTHPDGFPHALIVYRATLVDESEEFTLAENEIGEVRWIAPNELNTLSFWKEYGQALKQFLSQ